ncbi:AAA family ATPase [Candidatus Pacearchaeota archaeon]|nr:AAA family ATPase [Candidatus Pacearchaeota archaeon]
MKTIGIISLKGGVGKTSVVSSLGASLSRFNKKVLLVDGNLSAPNLGLHLNVFDPEITLHHVLNRENNVTEAVHELDNFDLIPSSMYYRKEINPLKLKDRIKFLKKKYDIILIDSSPALNDETLAVMLASDELFVVTTPDYPTLGTTIKAVRNARKRGTPITGLILNKVNNKKFEVSLRDIEKTVEVPVLAVIPHDLNVLKALSEFTPSTIHNPNSNASEEYNKLAATLIGEKYKPVKLRNFFRWVNPPKQDINRALFYERAFE